MERRQKKVTDAEEQECREFLCVLGSCKRLQCTSAKWFDECRMGFTTAGDAEVCRHHRTFLNSWNKIPVGSLCYLLMFQEERRMLNFPSQSNSSASALGNKQSKPELALSLWLQLRDISSKASCFVLPNVLQVGKPSGEGYVSWCQPL